MITIRADHDQLTVSNLSNDIIKRSKSSKRKAPDLPAEEYHQLRFECNNSTQGRLLAVTSMRNIEGLVRKFERLILVNLCIFQH